MGLVRRRRLLLGSLSLVLLLAALQFAHGASANTTASVQGTATRAGTSTSPDRRELTAKDTPNLDRAAADVEEAITLEQHAEIAYTLPHDKLRFETDLSKAERFLKQADVASARAVTDHEIDTSQGTEIGGAIHTARLYDLNLTPFQVARAAGASPSKRAAYVRKQLAAADEWKHEVLARIDKARGGMSQTPPPAPPEPVLKPIHAVFAPPASGQRCAPPSCTTVYTEDASGQDLIYAWSVSIPTDPSCAKGFHPNTPEPNQATWYHADESEGGTCNHSGTAYNATGSGHPGIVTVKVSNAHWTCVAVFDGTQGPHAQLTANGLGPHLCTRK